MQEALRHYYLTQLGIDGYLPRKPLSGALASAAPAWNPVAEQLVDDGVVEPLEVPSPATNESGTTDSSVAQVRAMADELSTGERKRALTPAAAAAGRPAGFNLNIWRVTGKALVVDSRQPQSALPTAKLLGNILIALGYVDLPLPKAEVLQWPLDPVAKHDDIEGRGMLSAFYEAQFTKQPFDFLLLMGEQALRYSLSEETGAAVDLQTLYGQQIVLRALLPAGQTVNAILVPSLADMLRQPLLKKMTWQAIQPLRAR